MRTIKLQYSWYEGEHYEYYVTHPTKTDEQATEDIKNIVAKLSDLPESAFDVKCLPSVYEKTITELETLGYVISSSIIRTIAVEDGVGDTFKPVELISQHIWKDLE